MSPAASSGCSICRLPFAPISSSHQHPCPFCGRQFSRGDSARRHAKTCPRKGNKSQLPKPKRGRKPQACDECARLKVQCDSKSPCQRCSSRDVVCSYRWLCNDPSHQNRHNQVGKAKTGPDTSNTSNHSNNRAPLSFLLNCTDPSVPSVVDFLVREEPDRDADSADAAQRLVSPDLETFESIDLDLPTSNFMTSFLNVPLDFLQDDLYDDSWNNVWAPVPLVHTNEKLAERIHLLYIELESLAIAKAKSHIYFPRTSFNELFTPSNIDNFIEVCIRRQNCHTPIIHWSSFNPEEVELPLLLAVVLGGALFSRPSYAPSAIPLHPIAEKYVFGKLKQCAQSDTISLESLHVCQAASILFGLQHSQKDPETRRRAVNKRHPAVVDALRRLQLIGNENVSIGHDCEWTRFIHQESCTRIVMWTFLNDALMTMCYNHPPSMTVSEMTGAIPCNEELWGAHRESFLKLSERNASSKQPCLRDLMAGLLAGEGVGTATSPLRQLSVHGLHAMIGAFQHIIFNFRTSMLPRTMLPPLSAALSRWRALWEVAYDRVPIDQRKWIGIPTHAPDLASLSELIIEISGTEKAKNSRYLQGIAGYDWTELHHFIQQNRRPSLPR